jgi:threonyl-tRNA synthetase
MRARLEKAGYVEVKTPQLVDRSLWEKSGHWEKFREHMFTAESEDKILALKPMNCPATCRSSARASRAGATCRCAWPSSAPATATSRRVRCTG